MRRLSLSAWRCVRPVLLVALVAALPPITALANCVTSGITVVCDSNPPQPYTRTVGTGPSTPSGFSVTVGPNAQIQVLNANSISLSNNASITIDSGAVVQTTTNSRAGNGLYGDGSNTIDVNNNSTITIQAGGSVIASGTQRTSEAINPVGAGNHIINFGLIEGGPSSAIFFQNVNTNANSPRNVVDNFGTIQAIPGGSNPNLTGEAIGSFGNVGIDFINETGAKVIGNLDFQGGNDNVTLNPHSSITGNFDGGGGFNTLTLNALGGSADSFTGIVKNFETLTKTGAGTWTLTGSIGANTAGGSIPLAVSVVGGTLVLTGNNSSFNGSVVVNPGANLATPGPDPTATLEARAQSLPPLITDHGIVLFNQVSPDGIQPNDGTYGGVIQGTGVVTKIGVGTLTLTGVSTYSGGTNLDQGTVSVSADNQLGAASGPLTFNGGTLQFASGFNLSPTRAITLNAASNGFAGGGTFDTQGFTSTIQQGITGAGALAKIGSGTLILTGANTYSGGTTIGAGTLQLGSGGTSGSLLGNVTDSGTLAFDRSDVVSFPGVISGSGGTAQIGTGTTILTSDNTYTGGTTISAGTLLLGDNTISGSIVGNVTDNATLAFGRRDSVTFAGVVSGTGALWQIGTGTTVLTGDNTYTGGTTISAGALELGDGGTSGSIVGNVSDNARLAFARSDTATFAGVISGTGAVSQIGTGTTILTGDSTYTGGTTISAGTLQLGDGGTSGSIVGYITDNAALAFDRADTATFPGVIFGTGTVSQIGSGTTILTGDNTYSGGTTISSGTLQLGNGGTTGSIIGDVADKGTLAFDRSDIVTFPGVISGSGGIAQIGTGTTILTADSPLTGATQVSAGALAIGDSTHPAAALSGAGPVSVAAGATLGGYGSVSGNVTNSGVVAAGNAVPGFAGGPTGTFTIGSLTSSGVIELAGSSVGNTLKVAGNYVSTGGSLDMRTVLNGGGPLSNQITDRLLVSGSADTTVVRIHATGPGAFTSVNVPISTDGISVIQVAGASSVGAFTLSGGYITGGTPYQYQLNAYGPGAPNGLAAVSQSLVGAAGSHWDYRLQNVFVTPEGPLPPVPEPPNPPTPPTPPPPPPGARPEVAPQVPAYLAAPVALFSAGLQNLDSLHRRLGEIRDDQAMDRTGQGEVFVRSFGGAYNYTTNRSFTGFGFNASEDYAALQFGGNWIALNDQAGTLRVGLAGTLGRFWMQPTAVDGASKALFNTQTAAGIVTYQHRSGWYVDAILSGGAFDGAISTLDRGRTTGLSGSTVAVSLEAGYPFVLPAGFSLEPQTQIVYQHLNFSNRTDVDGIGVDIGGLNQTVGRLGARLVHPFDGPDDSRITPYAKFNVLQGFGSTGAAAIGGTSFGIGNYGTSLQVGGGVTGSLRWNVSVYADVAWQQNVGGDGGFRGWSFNGGLRFLFGAAPPALAGPAAPAPAPARTYLVFFDWDRADLTDRARQVIGAAARASAQTAVTRIEVNGYADNSGTHRYNQDLSLRRARAVAAELVRDGVRQQEIAIQAFGDTHLLVPTGPGVREPQNRRVEIILR